MGDTPRKRRCECGGAEDCVAEIPISWEEEDAVDHGGNDLWIVAAGHELRGARRAVTVVANERFSVVSAVEEHDPAES